MTEYELAECFAHHFRVKVINSDYNFEGVIDTVFRKRDGIALRCVVESDDRVCLIQSCKNLERVKDEHEATTNK